ncbi:PKD domain-containing protein [Winogradskyella maritima]|nr:PKD domain-containing protein [Winogradskyella maritima]
MGLCGWRYIYMESPEHTFSGSGSYEVSLTVTDAFNETDTETITITVNDTANQMPQAVIDANPISGTAPLEVQFNGSNSTDDGPLTYAWDFADGVTSTLESRNIPFQEVGHLKSALL